MEILVLADIWGWHWESIKRHRQEGQFFLEEGGKGEEADRRAAQGGGDRA